ncbi:OLC1v1005843C1 [Oldenlandia corymbosa var. corymbosa]|uniref:OLC1v1005843C1 n=1 Tax=Oldenlandia corymbosa var. corymbosa TaxID=529605 RepID=A0AAV1DFX0_OLDCO|nr:OLC1v1005843C1 [Oldenlandia corymbosa var. corymbosa]
MDYGLPDHTGVNHDLPLSEQHKVPGRGRGFLQRRPLIGGSGQFQRAQVDMETQIHQIEQDAYASILRAFKAQSDALTWEKESLITELRKELRVSDAEHRKLLSMVNAEDIMSEIRVWRTATESRKKRKTLQSVAPMPLEIDHFQTSAEDLRWKSRGLPKPVSHGNAVALARRGGGSTKDDSRAHTHASLIGTERDSFGDIEILHTDTLIKQVEQVLSANHPDPADLEKVKKVLKDHEKALIDAIARLDDASDGESGNN